MKNFVIILKEKRIRPDINAINESSYYVSRNHMDAPTIEYGRLEDGASPKLNQLFSKKEAVEMLGKSKQKWRGNAYWNEEIILQVI